MKVWKYLCKHNDLQNSMKSHDCIYIAERILRTTTSAYGLLTVCLKVLVVTIDALAHV